MSFAFMPVDTLLFDALDTSYTYIVKALLKRSIIGV